MITGLGHLAFRITDLDRSLAFYCGTLGLEEAFQLHREGQSAPWIVYLHVAPGQFVELFPGAEGDVPPRGEGAGYNHFCLLVDDVPAEAQRLEAAGVTLTATPKVGADGNWQCWIQDPDGNAIELMQISPDSPQAKADAAS